MSSQPTTPAETTLLMAALKKFFDRYEMSYDINETLNGLIPQTKAAALSATSAASRGTSEYDINTLLSQRNSRRQEFIKQQKKQQKSAAELLWEIVEILSDYKNELLHAIKELTDRLNQATSKASSQEKHNTSRILKQFKELKYVLFCFDEGANVWMLDDAVDVIKHSLPEIDVEDKIVEAKLTKYLLWLDSIRADLRGLECGTLGLAPVLECITKEALVFPKSEPAWEDSEAL